MNILLDILTRSASDMQRNIYFLNKVIIYCVKANKIYVQTNIVNWLWNLRL